MDCRTLLREEYGRWDAFVDSSPQGSLYSKSAYLDAIGCRYDLLVAEKGEAIAGGIALTRNEVRMFANPLFVKYLGVLYAPETDGDASRQYKVDRAIAEHSKTLNAWSYAFHPNYRNWMALYWSGFSQTTRYSYRIDFSHTTDFREAYTEKVNAPLRAAERHGVRIANATIEETIAGVEQTYTARNKRPPYSRKHITEVLQKLNDAGMLQTKSVRDSSDNIHAVAAIAYDAGSANLILNGSDPEYRKQGGNTFLIDHLIEFASNNCAVFDFEGSMHERIERFYRGFGGDATPYFLISRNNLATRAYGTAVGIARWLLR